MVIPDAEGKTRRFVNHWPGDYAVYDAKGDMLDRPLAVNGEMMTFPARLEPGEYQLGSVDGTEPVFLLPADLPEGISPLLRPIRQVSLYGRHYTF